MVTVKQYKGLKAKKKVYKKTESMIQYEIAALLNAHTEQVEVTGRAAKEGDTVKIDFKGLLDGVPFDGGEAKDYMLCLGSHQFIPGFEEQIIGHEVGDAFSIFTTFPQNYQAKDLAGKETEFKILLHAIVENRQPVFDDAFAKKLGMNTKEEVVERITKQKEMELERQAEMELNNALMDQMLAGMEGDVSAEMIEKETDRVMEQVDAQLRSQGMDLKSYMAYAKTTEEEMRASYRMEAEQQLRMRLALQYVADQEHLTVADGDIENGFIQLASMYRCSVEEVKKEIPAEAIREDMVIQKAIRFVRENAVIE